MKRRIFCVAVMTGLIGLAGTAHAAPTLLANYDQLLQKAQQGEDVRAIVNIDKCTIKKSEMKDAASLYDSGLSTRLNFTIFSHYKVPVDGQEKYTVATSNMILTEHRAFGPVYAYGRLRVFEDNSAEFHTAYYDPKTYEQKGTVNYYCHLSNGADQNGVRLYDAS